MDTDVCIYPIDLSDSAEASTVIGVTSYSSDTENDGWRGIEHRHILHLYGNRGSCGRSSIKRNTFYVGSSDQTASQAGCHTSLPLFYFISSSERDSYSSQRDGSSGKQAIYKAEALKEKSREGDGLNESRPEASRTTDEPNSLGFRSFLART